MARANLGESSTWGASICDLPDGREDALQSCATGKKCGLLLEFDGWEFKDDYPLKL